MKMLIALGFALALCLPLSSAQAITVYKILVVCKFDIQQYCKGIKAKRIRELRECLAKHEKDLLPTCQDHYKEATP
jgi:hypothetical protein